MAPVAVVARCEAEAGEGSGEEKLFGGSPVFEGEGDPAFQL